MLDSRGMGARGRMLPLGAQPQLCSSSTSFWELQELCGCRHPDNDPGASSTLRILLAARSCAGVSGTDVHAANLPAAEHMQARQARAARGGISKPSCLAADGDLQGKCCCFACLKWQVCAPRRGGWQLQRAPGQWGSERGPAGRKPGNGSRLQRLFRSHVENEQDLLHRKR